MQHLNYWKQFEGTGKIEDYLSYRSCFSAEEKQKAASQGIENSTEQMHSAEQLGEHSYAGIHMCNRNDFETNAYRGI